MAHCCRPGIPVIGSSADLVMRHHILAGLRPTAVRSRHLNFRSKESFVLSIFQRCRSHCQFFQVVSKNCNQINVRRDYTPHFPLQRNMRHRRPILTRQH
jgi:hypothetical protein